MPLRAVIVLLAFVSMAAVPCGLLAGEFPYRATVTADDVFVRGGPGQNYYPTNKLQEGEAVEVYRHDPGGWYAIRPPRGSYSWVSARYLQELDDDVALVTAEEVVARVGSHLSDARDVWQVKLQREEEVRVLEKIDSTEGQWYRISPPRGEFRWIHGKYLQPDTADAIIDESDDSDAASSEGSSLRHVDVAALSQGRRHETRPAPVRPYKDNGPDDNGDPRLEPPRESDLQPARESADKLPEIRQLTLDQRDGRAALREIDAQLTARVCHEAELWNFTDLRTAAQGILQSSDSAVERTHARLTLERIARFEGIRQKQQKLQQDIAARQRPQSAVAQRRPGGAPTSARMASIDSRLDGQGRLLPVKSKNPNAPQFALVDERGKLKSFVTPAPGVNLRAYQGQTIGIIGSRGYSPELKAQHITAKRITVESTGTKLR